jgi:cell division septal protein FtsQ
LQEVLVGANRKDLQMEDKTVTKEKTPTEKKQAQSMLLGWLLIILVAVAIVYLGLNIGFALIGFGAWVLARIFGVG